MKEFRYLIQKNMNIRDNLKQKFPINYLYGICTEQWRKLEIFSYVRNSEENLKYSNLIERFNRIARLGISMHMTSVLVAVLEILTQSIDILCRRREDDTFDRCPEYIRRASMKIFTGVSYDKEWVANVESQKQQKSIPNEFCSNWHIVIICFVCVYSD